MVGISRRILISGITEPVLSVRSGNAIVCGICHFAYGGIEAVGGLVDKTENPEKNFAKGIVFAAIVISIGYSLAIFFMGRQHKLAAGIK